MPRCPSFVPHFFVGFQKKMQSFEVGIVTRLPFYQPYIVCWVLVLLGKYPWLVALDPGLTKWLPTKSEEEL